jgi:hypothetical protein
MIHQYSHVKNEKYKFFYITNLSVTDIQQNGLITFVNVVHAESIVCNSQGGGNLMMVSV